MFKPFPIGTVRGPYTCGFKTSYDGVQFLVHGKNGWVPFIRSKSEEKECRAAAEKYSQEILKENEN